MWNSESFIFYANSTTTGNFMHVLNGGTLRIDSGECKWFGTGLYVENTGVTAPTLDIQGMGFTDCTQDINIVHPLTQGSFEGISDHNKSNH